MKNCITLLLAAISCCFVNAQSVGIGTSNPNSSALLDITSTTKGMLIPRMTSAQRIAIASPAAGLMVFETTSARFWFFNGITWRQLDTPSSWATIGDNIYNSNVGNIGIGTISPSQLLDVDGNIRSRQDIMADGKVIATGIVSGSGLQTSGGLIVSNNGLVGGTFTANGSLATNGDLSINNIGATIQLKNGINVNKGFFQIAGDDVRFGTNSGNNLGNVIVRMNGNNRFTFTDEGRFTLSADNTPTINFNSGGLPQASLQVQGQDLAINAPGNKVRISNVLYADDATNRVGIGTISPSEMLHVNGNMLVTGNSVVSNGRITSTTNGSANNLLPLAYGKIDFNGNKLSGTDKFTSSNRTATGHYNLFITGANSSSVLVLGASRVVVFRIFYEAAGWYRLWVWDPILEEYVNADFHFVMYSP